MSRRDIRVAGRTVRIRRSWYDSPWRIAGQAVSAALVVALIALVVAIAVVPRIAGGTSLTVLTGSMEPTFSPGDVVVVSGIDAADVCADVSVGDIVTFMPEPDDPTLITHRVVGKTVGSYDDGTSCRLITQGDANSTVDEPVSPEQVRGVFLYGVPKLGWVRQWAGDHVQVLMIVAAVALVGYGIYATVRRPRTRVVAVTGDADESAATGAAGATPTGPTGAGASDFRADPAGTRLDLAERELALRERELDLRERELDFARRQEQVHGSDGLLAAETCGASLLGARLSVDGDAPDLPRTGDLAPASVQEI